MTVYHSGMENLSLHTSNFYIIQTCIYNYVWAHFSFRVDRDIFLRIGCKIFQLKVNINNTTDESDFKISEPVY